MYRTQGRDLDSDPPLRFVTASLKVDYLAPTPEGVELLLYGYIVEVGERKVIVDIIVEAEGVLCARGRVVAVRMPEHMAP